MNSDAIARALAAAYLAGILEVDAVVERWERTMGLNLRRADVDRLKATLTNCIRTGPQTQNRDGHPHFRAHLEGRLSQLERVNPIQGERLRMLFDRIPW